ncbi:glycosyltransferase domain-containing protein [Terrihabitans sp. B22-R8]|uniref:glycosyltransferase domain-containing protein n=1 Tax=Terrihabitans sp. B22-R8 TaxID=3425128 RepID=UPI00403D2AE3
MRRFYEFLLNALKPRPARRVVYTCMFGYSEAFADHETCDDGKTDYLCFTDDRSLTSTRWKFIFVDPVDLGPVRTAKMIKIMPHRFVGAYASSLYIDNTVQLIASPDEIWSHLRPDGSPLVCFHHPWWNCIYTEAEKIIELNYADPDVVNAQIGEYRAAGFPVEGGLSHNAILLRRHKDRRLRMISEAWWAQILRYSYRDQLSLPYVMWRQGFSADHFPGLSVDGNLVKWPVFSGPRIPRGFNDEVYLALHEDVRTSGMNPREHYLKWGLAEGRRWQ